MATSPNAQLRVGIIQSNYIPWRGYFDFISNSDLFIFHDDLQYTKGDWRNRNRIKTPAGPVWLTVPVKHNSTAQLICETEIDYSKNWHRLHLNKFKENYRKAPYMDFSYEMLRSSFEYCDRTISELNIRLIREICVFLGIATPMRLSSEYAVSGSKTERLISLLQRAGATNYLSGPSGREYLQETRFRECGIRLEYKTYHYAPYPQISGEFDGAVTILDLIANMGRDAREHLASRDGNVTA